MSVNSDRTYELSIHTPPATFLLKQAAGIQRGAMYPGKEISGKITRKHLYEIAQIKLQDPPNALLSLEVGVRNHKPNNLVMWTYVFWLQQMCTMLVGIARTCGIEIVEELKTEDYQQFLDDRREVVEQQRKELQEAREAKMLRTGWETIMCLVEVRIIKMFKPS